MDSFVCVNMGTIRWNKWNHIALLPKISEFYAKSSHRPRFIASIYDMIWLKKIINKKKHNVTKQVIPASAVWSLSFCSRMSMAMRTCCWPSSSGKLCWYNHSPNSNRIMTFCHWVSALWLQIQTYKSYSSGGLFKGYLLSGCKLGERPFVRNYVVMTVNFHMVEVECLKNYIRVRPQKRCLRKGERFSRYGDLTWIRSYLGWI